MKTYNPAMRQLRASIARAYITHTYILRNMTGARISGADRNGPLVVMMVVRACGEPPGGSSGNQTLHRPYKSTIIFIIVPAAAAPIPVGVSVGQLSDDIAH